MAKVAFTQAAVKRAVRGAQAAGVSVSRVEIDPKTGKIIIIPGGGNPEAEDLDRELAEFEAQHGDKG